jgi:hypothetical protein
LSDFRDNLAHSIFEIEQREGHYILNIFNRRNSYNWRERFKHWRDKYVKPYGRPIRPGPSDKHETAFYGPAEMARFLTETNVAHQAIIAKSAAWFRARGCNVPSMRPSPGFLGDRSLDRQ